MREVWVLSEESPFDDPEGSGGCVCGVYATAAAALFELGTWELGPEEAAQLVWTKVREDFYEAYGYGEAIYILRRHEVETEAAMRHAVRDYGEAHGLAPHPYLALSAAELEAVLPTEAMYAD